MKLLLDSNSEIGTWEFKSNPLFLKGFYSDRDQSQI